MQKDTRRLTVARDHLEAARQQLTLALDQTDVHVQQGAVRRALDQLQLARSRLLEQRELVRGVTDEAVHAAYDLASRAAEGIFGLIDRWPDDPYPALAAARAGVFGALAEIERACDIGAREAQMHP